MTTTPRGIRNCNPLNIRRSAAKWKGLCAQQNDASFCQFESMEWGWRAAFWYRPRRAHRHPQRSSRPLDKRGPRHGHTRKRQRADR